jgi:hypothetical protein
MGRFSSHSAKINRKISGRVSCSSILIGAIFLISQLTLQGKLAQLLPVDVQNTQV